MRQDIRMDRARFQIASDQATEAERKHGRDSYAARNTKAYWEAELYLATELDAWLRGQGAA